MCHFSTLAKGHLHMNIKTYFYLVTYMYAFYDSMKLDTNLQYDFLPINVKKAYNKQSYKDKMASHMQGYDNDQRL